MNVDRWSRCSVLDVECVAWARSGYGAGLPYEIGSSMKSSVLWIIAAILVIVGIVQLFQGQIIFGVVLIVAGCLVGPGGYSLFRTRA